MSNKKKNNHDSLIMLPLLLIGLAFAFIYTYWKIILIVLSSIIAIIIVIAIICYAKAKNNKKNMKNDENPVYVEPYINTNEFVNFETINTEIKTIENSNFSNSEDEKKEPIYTKTNLINNFEKSIYSKLISIVNNHYDVFPQINLASIIDKTTMCKYRNELFRNIDFGVFDKKNSMPLVLIEVNGETHTQAKRYVRDLKVREILKVAKIPLVTLYTSYPNEITYIKKRLKEYILID